MMHAPPGQGTAYPGVATPNAAPIVALGSRGGPPPPAAAPGFGAGVLAVFQGFGFVVATPAVWLYAMLPVFWFLLFCGGAAFAGTQLLPHRVDALLGAHAHWGHGALAIVVKVFAIALSAAIGAVIGFALAQPLSGPALEKIVRRVEQTLNIKPWPETSILQDIGRSIEGLLIVTGLSLPILIVLFAIGIVFPPAAIVTVPLKVGITALMLAWDLCDYPLSIRGMPIRARVTFLRRHLSAVLGFGLGLVLFSLIPCGLFLVLPIGAAGATRLIVQMEAWDRKGG